MEEQPRAEEVFSSLAELRSTKLPIPRSQKFSRSDVVSAFQSAFELIGGVPRFALWANANETEFYKLFSKMLPSASITELIVTPRDPNNVKTIPTHELEDILAQRILEHEGSAREDE